MKQSEFAHPCICGARGQSGRWCLCHAGTDGTGEGNPKPCCIAAPLRTSALLEKSREFQKLDYLAVKLVCDFLHPGAHDSLHGLTAFSSHDLPLRKGAKPCMSSPDAQGHAVMQMVAASVLAQEARRAQRLPSIGRWNMNTTEVCQHTERFSFVNDANDIAIDDSDNDASDIVLIRHHTLDMNAQSLATGADIIDISDEVIDISDED